MTTSHIVQHTHWDREWYFTAEDAKVLSDQVFSEALDELSRDPQATFCLDGQLSIVEDYVSFNPDRLPQIRDLMKEGRLTVGPWYTQSDCLLPGAESILRNLTIGILGTRRLYGDPMMIGYTPDTFGFNAQMPTLLQHAGIDSFIGWRGIDFSKHVPSPYFTWHGLGDQSVLTANMPRGYSMGVMPAEALGREGEFVRAKLDPETQFASELNGDEDILMPAGVDQKSMMLDFQNIVDSYNEESDYHHVASSFPEFIELLRGKSDLPEYRGEFREPVLARVHRTIGSVRTQMKQADTELELRLVRRIEPLMSIARCCGVEISTGLLERAWKKLFENQAHDSMGGCVSDNVAEDIFHRIKEVDEICDGIENLVTKRIADALDLGPQDILVFNTESTPFSGEKTVHVTTRTKNIAFEGSPYAVIEQERYYPARENATRHAPMGDELVTEPAYHELDVRIHVELPALGYKVIKMLDAESPLEEYAQAEGHAISRGGAEASFDRGAVRLSTPDGIALDNAFTLVDGGNDGDTYDFSPIEGERERVLPWNGCSVRHATGVSELVLHGEAELPYDLDARKGASDRTGSVSYTLTVRIDNEGRITGRIICDNEALSHRLRLRVETGCDDGRSVAQIQNGFLRRERVEAPSDWRDRYVEKPEPIEIFNGSVSVETEGGTISLLTDDSKEYERLDTGLYVTLFATTGQLGKPDLAWRPGRASGDTTTEGHVMMPTPLAEELGEHDFSFELLGDTGTIDEEAIAKATLARQVPSVSYQRQELNLFIHRLDNKIWRQQVPPTLERTFSALELAEGLMVSTLTPALSRKDALVVRFMNPTASEVTLRAGFLPGAQAVNAIEDAVDAAGVIPPYGFASYLIPVK